MKKSSVLSYNDYGKELIAKSNELFYGTEAYISIENLHFDEDIGKMHIIKRAAMITAIYRNKQLQSHNVWPITPLESEQLLKEDALLNANKYWEDLALILYDRNKEGANPEELDALYKNLRRDRVDLGLSKMDLELRLLIVNIGLKKDENMPHGVKSAILAGLTKVYPHETLQKTGQNHRFDYGLEYGLPSIDKLGCGNRMLCMPYENERLGLRVLYRRENLALLTWGIGLCHSLPKGKITLMQNVQEKGAYQQ